MGTQLTIVVVVMCTFLYDYKNPLRVSAGSNHLRSKLQWVFGLIYGSPSWILHNFAFRGTWYWFPCHFEKWNAFVQIGVEGILKSLVETWSKDLTEFLTALQWRIMLTSGIKCLTLMILMPQLQHANAVDAWSGSPEGDWVTIPTDPTSFLS